MTQCTVVAAASIGTRRFKTLKGFIITELGWGRLLKFINGSVEVFLLFILYSG